MIMNRRTRYFLAKILTSPRHFLNACLAILSFRLRFAKVYGNPVVVDIEPSNICNFRCPHCEVTYTRRKKKNLDLEQFKVIIRNFPYALRVKLQGEGEPFINNILYDLIEYTCSEGVWCEVFTNGSILDMERLKSLEQFKNFKLVVSFDAADKATFEKIRPGSDFGMILDNIGRITGNTTIEVAAWMLLLEENKEQVEEVIHLLAEKEVRSLGLQRLFFSFDKRAVDVKKTGKWINRALPEKAYESYRECAGKVGVQLTVSDKLYDRGYLCPWPWMGVFVDTSGNVVPCCRIGDADVCSMGNLNEESMDEIWNSEVYRDFRRKHIADDLPEYCSACYADTDQSGG